MRLITVCLLLAFMLISVSSAELLITANPIGKGKLGFLGSYLQDSNVLNNSSYGANTLGGYAGYGLTDKLDVLVSLGQVTLGGLPAGFSSSVTGYGLTLKYLIAEEGASLPVSVALGAGYKLMTTKFTGVADTNGSQSLLGVGVSKIMVPFIPYGGLVYRSVQSGGALSSQIDATLGTALAWSLQGAIFAEITLQSITAAGTTYSSPQTALAVAYVL